MRLDGIKQPIKEDVFFNILKEEVIKLKIIEVSDVKNSYRAHNKFFISITFKLLHNVQGFKKNDVVIINFTLSEKDGQEYRIKPNAKLWPILNYAFIISEVVGKENKEGIILTEDEIKEALLNLEFIGVPTIERPKNKEPFNILKVL